MKLIPKQQLIPYSLSSCNSLGRGRNLFVRNSGRMGIKVLGGSSPIERLPLLGDPLLSEGVGVLLTRTAVSTQW